MSDQLPFCVTNHANRIGKFDSLLQKCKGEYFFLPKTNYQTLPLTFISDNNNFFVKTFFLQKRIVLLQCGYSKSGIRNPDPSAHSACRTDTMHCRKNIYTHSLSPYSSSEIAFAFDICHASCRWDKKKVRTKPWAADRKKISWLKVGFVFANFRCGTRRRSKQPRPVADHHHTVVHTDRRRAPPKAVTWVRPQSRSYSVPVWSSRCADIHTAMRPRGLF